MGWDWEMTTGQTSVWVPMSTCPYRSEASSAALQLPQQLWIFLSPMTLIPATFHHHFITSSFEQSSCSRPVHKWFDNVKNIFDSYLQILSILVLSMEKKRLKRSEKIDYVICVLRDSIIQRHKAVYKDCVSLVIAPLHCASWQQAK